MGAIFVAAAFVAAGAMLANGDALPALGVVFANSMTAWAWGVVRL